MVHCRFVRKLSIFGTKTRWRYNGWSHANPITKTLLDNVLHAEGEFNEFGELFGIVEYDDDNSI
jgi:hypothetical protein